MIITFIACKKSVTSSHRSSVVWHWWSKSWEISLPNNFW